MAKFELAYKETSKVEGLYANNPADTGGETWAGISRNNFPTWSGWIIIDAIKHKYGKSTATINKYGRLDNTLHDKEIAFWKKNFWDVLKLDFVNDQQLANSVYDFGVNSGTSRAGKYLQTAYNSCKGLKALSVDGLIGSKTLNAINTYDAKFLYNTYNKFREEFYRSIAKGNQAQFLKSWLSRLKPYK